MTMAASGSHEIAGPGRCAQCGSNFTITPMNWERISGNWTQWKGRVRERWGKLSDDQLDVAAGRRDQLAGHIQEIYGLSKDETERQLRNWERNHAVEYNDGDPVVDDEPDSTEINGRG